MLLKFSTRLLSSVIFASNIAAPVFAFELNTEAHKAEGLTPIEAIQAAAVNGHTITQRHASVEVFNGSEYAYVITHSGIAAISIKEIDESWRFSCRDSDLIDPFSLVEHCQVPHQLAQTLYDGLILKIQGGHSNEN